MSFASLKQSSGNALQNLQQKVQESSSGGGNRDPRFWKLAYDKNTKVGSATIRFLPFGADTGRLPWAEWAEFSFKNKGGNYWERSLKTIGKDDPVAELNHLQWERNQGNDQDEVRKRSRRLRYVANIVVVNDPAHPENNGKNFLFEYGPAIHKKIIAAMVPEYEDQAPVNVFDLWTGANFKVRTKDKSGFLNYDDSGFDPAAPLHGDDGILEQFYNGMHDLAEFESDDKYKTFEELEKQMMKVLGAAYVAQVRGEEFNPTQAAAAGANPFGAPQDSAPAQQPAADPFANQGQAPAQSADPFANQGQAPAQSADPFAGQQQSAPAAGGNDPFAGAAGAPAGDDPFGDLNL